MVACPGFPYTPSNHCIVPSTPGSCATRARQVSILRPSSSAPLVFVVALHPSLSAMFTLWLRASVKTVGFLRAGAPAARPQLLISSTMSSVIESTREELLPPGHESLTCVSSSLHQEPPSLVRRLRLPRTMPIHFLSPFDREHSLRSPIRCQAQVCPSRPQNLLSLCRGPCHSSRPPGIQTLCSLSLRAPRPHFPVLQLSSCASLTLHLRNPAYCFHLLPSSHRLPFSHLPFSFFSFLGQPPSRSSRLVEYVSYRAPIIMPNYDPFVERAKNEQTVRERPPLSAESAALDLFRNLCHIPKTENAQQAWLKDVAVIRTDLEQLAKYPSSVSVSVMAESG